MKGVKEQFLFLIYDDFAFFQGNNEIKEFQINSKRKKRSVSTEKARKWTEVKSIALRQYGLFPWNAETGEKKREKGEKPNTESVLTVNYDFYGKIKLQDVTIRSGSLVHGWIIKVFALIARKMKRKVYMWRSFTHKCCSPFFKIRVKLNATDSSQAKYFSDFCIWIEKYSPFTPGVTPQEKMQWRK